MTRDPRLVTLAAYDRASVNDLAAPLIRRRCCEEARALRKALAQDGIEAPPPPDPAEDFPRE